MSRFMLVGTVLLTGAISIAQADVYRWVDEHGEPHYSDQWVPGSTVIKTSKAHPGSDTLAQSHAPPAARTGNGAASASQDPVAVQENARAAQQDAERAHAAQCKAASDRYMKSIDARKIYNVGKNGDHEYMTDADADAYRAVARKDVLDLCGSVPEFVPNVPIPEPQPIPEPKPIPNPKVNPADATSD